MLLSLGIGVRILSLFRVLEGESPRIGWVLLSALGLGMGILAKGPIALALPALVMAVDFFIERYSLRQVGGFLLASLLALVIPVLYYLDLLRWHGATTLKEFLLRDNVERFVAGFGNLQPWWFYLKHTPVDLLPMTLLLPAATLLSLLAIVGSLLGVREMVRQRYAAAQGILITVMAGVWLVSIFYIYPDANRLNSPRFFAQEIRHLVPTDAPLDSYGLYR